MKNRSANRRILQSPIPNLAILLLAILLLASFLRFYRLDAQSFWNDEGNSARIAERTVRLILEGAAGDIHPPGYYLLLHAWRAFCGHSEFALRTFSVFAGVLAVAFSYALGRRLFGTVTGLMAAFLAAISPLAVYYSQEARMYALLGMLSAASTYLLLHVLAKCQATRLSRSRSQPLIRGSALLTNFHQFRISLPHQELKQGHWRVLFPTGPRKCTFCTMVSPPGRTARKSAEPLLIPNLQSLITYIWLATAGLYTHYAFVFILLVHNAVFGIWWLLKNRHWRHLAVWVGTQAAIVALYLPWLHVALRATGWPSAGMTVGLEWALLDVLRVLTVGITLPLERATLALVVAVILLLVGLWPRKGGWFAILVAFLHLLLPTALIFAFDLYKPAWLKFFIVVLPAFDVLVARGVNNLTWLASRQISKSIILQSPLSILAVAFFSIVTYPSLRNLYLNPAYARDDYRRIAADIAAAYRQGDAIILNAPNQWEVFTYYYPDRDVYPAPYHPTSEQAETFLAPLILQYRRLFVLYWGDVESDPQRLIETWLAFHAYKAADRWYGRVRLATYGVASLPDEPVVILEARFGESIRLRGLALADERLAPGNILPVTLFWEAEAAVPARYKVTVQLLNTAGQLVAQHDGEPADGLAPTDGWQPGRRVLDRHGIALPGDLPPGRYTLAVALYSLAGGMRLPVTRDGAPVGDLLTLTSIEVEPTVTLDYE